MRQFLVHVDRQAFRPWLEMAGIPGIDVASEVGEAFRVIDRPADFDFAATGLVRYVQPVDEVLSRAEILASDGTDSRLLALAKREGASQVSIFTIRRYGARIAERLTRALESALAPMAEASLNAPVLMIAVSDQLAFAGVTSRAASLSPFPGGLPPYRAQASDALSRARFKLREALDWLAIHGHPAREWSNWLELGAFPGGMTSELAELGRHVLAVDLATPTPSMRALPGVEHVTANAHFFTPPAPVDAVLCDVNGPPHLAIDTVARLAPHLKTGGLVYLTLKLPQWSALPAVRERLANACSRAGFVDLELRHVFHNRQEITALARKL